MISEIFFSRFYNYFWNELLPGRESYVRKINKFDQTKNKNLKRPYETIQLEEASGRRALINDVSFKVFKEVCLGHAHTIKAVNVKETFDISIDDNESNIVNLMTKRLLETFSHKKKLEVSPIITGCGIINEVRGDIFFDGTLVEIKARDYPVKYKLTDKFFEWLESEKLHGNVMEKLKGMEKKRYEKRADFIGAVNAAVGLEQSNHCLETILKFFYVRNSNFKGLDLQQLLIYGALNHMQRQEKNFRNIERFQLFNPRTGFIWEEDVEKVALWLGGCSSTDIYSEIINFISDNTKSL